MTRLETRHSTEKRKELERQRDEAVDVTGNPLNEQRRLQAFRRAGAGQHYPEVVASVIDALRENDIPFMVAPYESDGQLAFLSNQGYIDLIITEDSDLIAYGASPILYKLSNDTPSGTLIRREDLSANQQSKNIDLTDWSPIMLAVLFVALGSDYGTKLKGIGLVGTCRMVRAAFLEPINDATQCPLSIFLKRLFEETLEPNVTDELKREYTKSFLEGLYMFRHPVVYDPVKQRCCTVGEPEHGGGDPELVSYPPYAALCRDAKRREQIAGPLLEQPLAIYVAEGWISPRTKRPYKRNAAALPEYIVKYMAESPSEARVPAGDEGTDLVDLTEGSGERNHVDGPNTDELKDSHVDNVASAMRDEGAPSKTDLAADSLENAPSQRLQGETDFMNTQVLSSQSLPSSNLANTKKRGRSDDQNELEMDADKRKPPEIIDLLDNDSDDNYAPETQMCT